MSKCEAHLLNYITVGTTLTACMTSQHYTGLVEILLNWTATTKRRRKAVLKESTEKVALKKTTEKGEHDEGGIEKEHEEDSIQAENREEDSVQHTLLG